MSGAEGNTGPRGTLKPEASTATMASGSGKAPAMDTDSVKRGIEWLDKMMSGLQQKNVDAKKAFDSDTAELAVVDGDIAASQAKLDAVRTNLSAKKAQLARVNAAIGEKSTDVASLLANAQALLKNAKKMSRMHQRDAASDGLEIARGYSSKIDTKTLIRTGPMGTSSRPGTMGGE
mmetsp:Transcript_5796/g.14709  ORF Transcript_5796/g.14709 Transcript_5796/m.14709 type:complete len:176 (-) Transcript_5796:90-617(-)|eukprot:CAMPEP_0197617560 /NCGR_PEP_ID=MMETSP1326-20131121/61095_1 /TAXON_ID=1155430 /ORGANISM="Genus nov. species nov., Strain RCC2288" /LENGTH=175 /DNA_ID=CAMNT_0043186455 /DNA_START=27 /DNA_END=554 /DNA_ORIENTATION=+